MKNIIRSLSAFTILLAWVAAPIDAQQGGGPGRRSYVAGHYFLELAGVNAGWLHSAEGGHATSDVVVEKLGPDQIARKHLGGVKYDDLVVTCGFAMNPAFYNWIGESLKNNYQRKDGSIHAFDFDFKARTERKFTQAIITELCIPACDAEAKEEGFLTLKFHAETVSLPQRDSGDGAELEGLPPHQKRWIPRNFRLTIDGVDCTRVARIEALSIKQKVTENAVGQERDYQKEPASVETPNLVVTFPETHSKDFSDWHEDFVIRGNNGNDHEKSGKLEFLSPDLQTVLGTIRFFNLGIFKLVPDTASPKNCDCELCKTVVEGANTSGAQRRLKASLYIERLELVVP